MSWYRLISRIQHFVKRPMWIYNQEDFLASTVHCRLKFAHKEAQRVCLGLRRGMASSQESRFSIWLKNAAMWWRARWWRGSWWPPDLLHCKTGCWFLPSLCFASSRPRPRRSQPDLCSRPPAGGPRWWLWQSTTQSRVHTLWAWLLIPARAGERFPGDSAAQKPPANAGDTGSVPGLGRCRPRSN